MIIDFAGYARRRDRLSDPNILTKIKKSILSINNTDNLCLPRATITPLSLLEKNENEEKGKLYVRMRYGKPV